jgi:alanyl-tRNA synthetase
MPTQRLYYDDPYLVKFNARVSACSALGGKPAVALDQSAFYPEGGGQAADHGTINGARVCDVQVRNGEVWHILDTPPAADFAVDDQIQGRIDWERRFDFMQQHLGQHILTAAFAATADLTTTSAHLGEQRCTLDLDISTLQSEQVQAAEELANRVIWENRPVLARFVTPDELATLLLRKAPAVSGGIRIVSIHDFDHNPCGGTHPHRTGEVGMIAVQGWTRHKGGVRVEFVCGGRVLRDYRRINGILSQTAATMSVAQDEIRDALARLRSTNDSNHKELERLRKRLLTTEAQRLLDTAEIQGAVRVVRAALPAEDAPLLRGLAQHLAEQPGTVALLGAGPERANLVAACAADTGLDAREILATALPLVQGRGGGNALLAQGSGKAAEHLEAALDAMHQAAIQALTQ